jgi:hypothetical protein
MTLNGVLCEESERQVFEKAEAILQWIFGAREALYDSKKLNIDCISNSFIVIGIY